MDPPIMNPDIFLNGVTKLKVFCILGCLDAKSMWKQKAPPGPPAGWQEFQLEARAQITFWVLCYTVDHSTTHGVCDGSYMPNDYTEMVLRGLDHTRPQHLLWASKTCSHPLWNHYLPLVRTSGPSHPFSGNPMDLHYPQDHQRPSISGLWQPVGNLSRLQ